MSGECGCGGHCQQVPLPVEIEDEGTFQLVGDPRYLALLAEMADIHKRKNAGYSGADQPDRWANFRHAEGFGVSALVGCLIRLSDKYIRVQNLVRQPANEQVGESVRDTLVDLASYALIAVCLLEEEQRGAQR